eukprot:c6068_g1_i2.p1 GENE.c6068_g1_i2~~c6068_g1_i2.p1  ORF type:complete len:273 (-),score=42.85 c6068_g1_i2:114-881(-)
MRTEHSESIATVTESILSHISHGQKDYIFECCGRGFTKGTLKFLIPLVLFATITSAQVVGALIAHSLALLADCVSMFLDTLTYAGNLWAEMHPTTHVQTRRRNQLIASGVSFLALLAVTLTFLVQGIQVVVQPDDEEDDNVDPYIVFGFAVAGILFDLISLSPFFFKHESDSATHMNTCSALVHILSDLLRSSTTLAASIMIWTTNYNSTKIDGYAALIVTSIILVGLVGALFSWFRDVRKYYSEDDPLREMMNP